MRIDVEVIDCRSKGKIMKKNGGGTSVPSNRDIKKNRASYFRSDGIEIFISKDNNGTKVPTPKVRKQIEVFYFGMWE